MKMLAFLLPRPLGNSALGGIGPKAKDAVPALIEALKDEDKYVREYAVSALGKIGTEAKAAVPQLMAVLKNADGYLHQFAAWALERINTPEAQKAQKKYKQKSG